MQVVELVMSKMAHGWSPEELHFQYPHISLGQIHSALAYYWDHQDALDADIKRRREKVEAMKRNAPSSRIAQKLKEQGFTSVSLNFIWMKTFLARFRWG